MSDREHVGPTETDECGDPECGVCHLCQHDHHTSKHLSFVLNGTGDIARGMREDLLRGQLAQMTARALRAEELLRKLYTAAAGEIPVETELADEEA